MISSENLNDTSVTLDRINIEKIVIAKGFNVFGSVKISNCIFVNMCATFIYVSNWVCICKIKNEKL